MIVITGATGHIGSSLVRLLSARGLRIRALTRNPGSAPPVRGVEWVRGDLAAPEPLPKLFSGADTIFLLTSNGQNLATLQRNGVAGAKQAGVSRIVKQSALGASDHSKSPIGRAHHEVEKAIEGSGMAWTFLRPHVFMQNLLALAPSIASEGVLRSPSGEGKIPFIDARDIAQVAAVVLTSAGHDGKKYVLTGPKAMSYREVAAAVQAATGKGVKYIAETDAEARARMAQGRAAPWEIDSALALASYQRAGGPTEAVSPVVQQVLGRPPRSVEAFVAENARAFGGK